MGALEKFLHDDPVKTPVLVKAALAHAQFETIHPFLDGNGRVGRLLITLLLCAEEQQVMSRPLLYLSLYLKRNRDEYYTHLQRVRTHGEWEPWLRFFLEGVNDVARSATDTTRRLLALVEEDRQAIHGLRRASGSALRLHELAIRQIVFRIPEAAHALSLSEVTSRPPRRISRLSASFVRPPVDRATSCSSTASTSRSSKRVRPSPEDRSRRLGARSNNRGQQEVSERYRDDPNRALRQATEKRRNSRPFLDRPRPFETASKTFNPPVRVRFPVGPSAMNLGRLVDVW